MTGRRRSARQEAGRWPFDDWTECPATGGRCVECIGRTIVQRVVRGEGGNQVSVARYLQCGRRCVVLVPGEVVVAYQYHPIDGHGECTSPTEGLGLHSVVIAQGNLGVVQDCAPGVGSSDELPPRLCINPDGTPAVVQQLYAT